MALCKTFRDARHEMSTIDRFEAGINKIMRDAAKKALRDVGYEIGKGDSDGDIVIVGHHLPEEIWDHCFSIDISTRCQH